MTVTGRVCGVAAGNAPSPTIIVTPESRRRRSRTSSAKGRQRRSGSGPTRRGRLPQRAPCRRGAGGRTADPASDAVVDPAILAGEPARSMYSSGSKIARARASICIEDSDEAAAAAAKPGSIQPSIPTTRIGRQGGGPRCGCRSFSDASLPAAGPPRDAGLAMNARDGAPPTSSPVPIAHSDEHQYEPAKEFAVLADSGCRAAHRARGRGG